jgi:hypothetical protein
VLFPVREVNDAVGPASAAGSARGLQWLLGFSG